MHELVFLESLVIILGISAIVIFALGRIRIPSIIGFLLAGMLLGPHDRFIDCSDFVPMAERHQYSCLHRFFGWIVSY